MEGKVLKVREVGDPILSTKCKKVDVHNINYEVIQDIEDLKATLEFSEGFGIAAPQIGIDKRIVVIKVDKEKCSYEDSEDIPVTVMINPVWKPASEKTNIEYEGCLSVPSIRGKVERYKKIEVNYYNEKGEHIEKTVQGFLARDIQHECDHLDGIVFLERVTGHDGFATKDMINKFDLKNKNDMQKTS